MSWLRNRPRGGWRAAITLSMAIGLLAPVWAPAPAGAQALLPATATAAPEETVLYHQVSLDRDGAQWQQTEDLLARVGVPDALDIFEEEILAEGARNGDFTQADLDALLGGEMAVVVTPPAVEHFRAMMALMEQMGGRYGDRDDKDGMGMAGTPVARDPGMIGTPMAGAPAIGGPVGVAAVLMPGDADAAWDYVQRQFDAVAADGETDVQVESYNGSDLLVIEGLKGPHGRGDKDGRKKDKDKTGRMGGYPLQAEYGLVAARAGAFIVAGMNRDDVTAIVDVINGEAASLAESREAQRVRAQLPAQLLSFTYLDGPALVEAIGPEMIEAWINASPGATMGEVEAYEGIGIGAQPVGFRFDSIAIPAEGATLPQAQVENNPDILATAEQAPADSFLFHAGAIPENAFAGAAYLISVAVNGAAMGEGWEGGPMMTAPPTAEEVQREIEQASATLGFNPQTDLIDLLGDEFIVFAGLPSISMGGFGWDAVAAITTTDEAALAETAQKIADQIERAGDDVGLSTREVDGGTVYVTGIPDMDEAPALEFGVVDGQLVFGSGSGIDDLVGDPDTSLAADEQFQEVMATLPSEAYRIGYVDLAQLVDLVNALMTMGQDETVPATPVASDAGSLENIRALGSVAFQKGDMAGASAVLYIAGGE